MIAPKERAVSHYEVIVHPNEENEVEDVLRRSMFEQPVFNQQVGPLVSSSSGLLSLTRKL